MLFNSYEFLIFFPLVTALFFLLPHRIRWAHLLLASFVFYMAFLPVYVLILIITILVDYCAGIIIERSAGARRKRYLIYSLIANIGFLCLFKYWDFFTTSLNDAFTLHLPLLRDMWLSHWIVTANNSVNTGLNHSIGTHLPLIQNVILPIGLSFHTFQAMSYTIEVYRGNQKAERHLGIYALYVMFYPQLVAGPIERPQNVLHQFHEVKKFSWDNLQSGLRLMAWGLFKKVVIADRISSYVDIVYNEPASFHYLNVIIATVLFAIQIYCDFSGYSDMAIGIARTMGYDLMINFNRPYFSKNIRQFWSRWHISLSTWFRDYLYIPLGGNRVSEARLYVNTAIVFVLSGFWHGANWTFIIWGSLHAVYTIVHIFYHKRLAAAGVITTPAPMNARRRLAGFFNFLFTFFFVCIAWVFFRAPSVHAAFEILHRMFSSAAGAVFEVALTGKKFHGEFGGTSIVISILMILFMLVVEWKVSPRLSGLDRRPVLDGTFMAVTTLLIVLFGVFSKASFIYFQF